MTSKKKIVAKSKNKTQRETRPPAKNLKEEILRNRRLAGGNSETTTSESESELSTQSQTCLKPQCVRGCQCKPMAGAGAGAGAGAAQVQRTSDEEGRISSKKYQEYLRQQHQKQQEFFSQQPQSLPQMQRNKSNNVQRPDWKSSQNRNFTSGFTRTPYYDDSDQSAGQSYSSYSDDSQTEGDEHFSDCECNECCGSGNYDSTNSLCCTSSCSPLAVGIAAFFVFLTGVALIGLATTPNPNSMFP